MAYDRKVSLMQSLNPTLWRTCKMLTGKTRLKLLRQLQNHPGLHVSALGNSVHIGHAAASQELRRIQSRGFLQTKRRGVYLIYRMVAYPQVSSASPLLEAIQTALSLLPPERDEEMALIAAGLSHERRIRIVRALLKAPRSASDVQFALHIPDHSFREHLRVLLASGFVAKSGHLVRFQVPDHPLAQALAKLIQKGAIR